MAPILFTRLLVLDSSPSFLQGLEHWLNAEEYKATLRHTLTAELQDQLGDFEIAIIGPDIQAPANLELCRALQARAPHLRLILLSPDAEAKEFQTDAAASGAWACLHRDVDRASFLTALADVRMGRLLFAPQILIHAREPLPLTARELELLVGLNDGLTDREIAERLCISVHTVSNHLASIFQKLGVKNRYEAVRRTRNRGWLANTVTVTVKNQNGQNISDAFVAIQRCTASSTTNSCPSNANPPDTWSDEIETKTTTSTGSVSFTVETNYQYRIVATKDYFTCNTPSNCVNIVWRASAQNITKDFVLNEPNLSQVTDLGCKVGDITTQRPRNSEDQRKVTESGVWWTTTFNYSNTIKWNRYFATDYHPFMFPIAAGLTRRCHKPAWDLREPFLW